MKNIFESPEVCAAYYIIDYCYYRLKELREKMNVPQNPIAVMVHSATGYGDHRTKKWIDDSIEYTELIIENKKIIEADYSNDIELLEELEQLKKTY